MLLVKKYWDERIPRGKVYINCHQANITWISISNSWVLCRQMPSFNEIHLQYFYPHTVLYPCSTLCSRHTATHCHPSSKLTQIQLCNMWSWAQLREECGGMFQYFTEDTVFTLIYLVDEQLQDQHNTIKTQTQKFSTQAHCSLLPMSNNWAYLESSSCWRQSCVESSNIAAVWPHFVGVTVIWLPDWKGH